MTREFSDELLSALLDGELSDSERAHVERHLAANPADRQLLDDLRSLRGEVASLPRAPVSPDFADRVVRAALAEAEKQNEARGMVSRAPPVERHFWRRWKLGAAAASAAALAACVLLVVQVWRHKDAPQPGSGIGPLAGSPVDAGQAVAAVAALPDQLLAALASAAPRDRDAVVLRLRVGKDASLTEALDAALAKAGISPLASDAPGPAALVQEAYRRTLEAAALASSSETQSAADAIFIEAPLQSLQDVFAELASAIKDPLQLETQGKLALRRGSDDDRAEGEGNATPAKPFAQHLEGGLFRLFDAPAGGTASLPPAALQPNQAVRVLILVEPR